MSFCSKCGAYIPMDETACPACGYDPQQEQARQEAERAEQARREEAKRRQEEKRSREQYHYAGARQQEYQYGTGSAQQESRREQAHTYEQTRQERRTSGTGTGTRTDSAGNRDWQWNGGQRPLWEDPNKPKPDYAAYARRAKEQAAESVNSRYLSVLSYMGPLFLVPLLLRKNDAFVKHHANQGLTLLLFNALVTLAEEFVPFGGLLSLAGGLFSLVCVVKGILAVVNGRMDKLPLLGDIRLIK